MRKAKSKEKKFADVFIPDETSKKIIFFYKNEGPTGSEDCVSRGRVGILCRACATALGEGKTLAPYLWNLLEIVLAKNLQVTHTYAAVLCSIPRDREKSILHNRTCKLYREDNYALSS